MLTVFVSTVTAEIVNYEGILLSVLYVLLLFVAIFVPSEQFKIKSNIIKSFKYVLSIAVLLSLPFFVHIKIQRLLVIYFVGYLVLCRSR